MAASLGAAASNACNLPFEPTLASAQVKAAQRHCPVLLLFTGLDWSPRSIALDRRLLEHAIIEKVIEDSFVPVLVDFPQRVKLAPDLQRANLVLAERFKITHFPTIVALDGDAREIGRLEFKDETVTSLKGVLDGWARIPSRDASRTPK
ncbi:MAG: thioredoxin family protein [Verrucomicrobiaceae bacterium]|nr:thioredoxin family protein [Verrucomicrobiaceae bacterium]